MVARRALGVRIGRKAVLGLGDAYRKMAETGFLQFGQPVLGGLLAGDVAGPVDLLRDRLDLVAQRHLVGIEKPEIGLAAVGERDDGAGEIRRPLAAARPMVGD